MKVSRLAAMAAFLFLMVSRSSAQGTVQTPHQFLPHQVGEQFTPHHLLTDYFEYLAEQSPSTMQLSRYGRTNEARPLQLAIFSSSENMARIESIRANNIRLAGFSTDGQEGSTDRAPAIVWLNMSIHGNEPSGSECSMLLAYELATQTNPQIKEWLKNVVVVMDPSANPDGYDRYTHWYRGVSNLVKNINGESREHQETWPSGRSNHYQFDLNRDWAWATQTETRQRLPQYHHWLPQVVADVHEQFIDDHYYFAPAAEPFHAYITAFQRDFQGTIGQNHARYFDQHGWLYFTSEVFDLLYPSYGDTYPMFNGAVGMTYEQAGNGQAGRAILTTNGDTLTLSDRILHQYTTCLSTIEIASQNAGNLLENFKNYFQKAKTSPAGRFKSFIINGKNDPNRINQLCAWLDLHHIRYGKAGAITNNVRGFDYRSADEKSWNIAPDDVVISAFQPQSVLLQVLFEPNPWLSDSLTYDITAWSIPWSYGLEVLATEQRIEPKKKFEPIKAPTIRLAASPYAWCVHRKSMADLTWVAALVQKGVKIRYATEQFMAAEETFAPGSFVINRADNRAIEADLDTWVMAAAKENNVTLHPIFTGFLNKGAEVGSAKFRLVHEPQVAILYGEEVDENAYGHTWYFFEKELKMPVTQIRPDQINIAGLQDINTLIIPSGNYNLEEKTYDFLQDWVNEGGRIIAFENGVKVLADHSGFDLAMYKEEEKKNEEKKQAPNSYQSREREAISGMIPGAIVKATTDPSHPLAYGLGTEYYSLKTHANVFPLNNNLSNAVWLEDNYSSYGFIGSKIKPKLQQSTLAAMQPVGHGTVVYLVDNPVFRAFWQTGKILFANSLFF